MVEIKPKLLKNHLSVPRLQSTMLLNYNLSRAIRILSFLSFGDCARDFTLPTNNGGSVALCDFTNHLPIVKPHLVAATLRIPKEVPERDLRIQPH